MSKEELHEFRLEVKELHHDAKRMHELSNMNNDCDLNDIAGKLDRHLRQFNA